MLLAEMSWDEVEAYLEENDRVIVPLGSTEQHGRKGPLGTDHIIPEGLARALAEETGTPAAPVLAYGVSEHHMAFPGTVTIRPRTWIAFVEDMLESLYRHGFRRVLVLNGHGGNTPPLWCLFTDLCNRHHDLKVRQYSWWTLAGVGDLERELFGPDAVCHASPGEVSLAEYVRPSVHKDKTVPAGVPLPWPETFASYAEMRRVFPDGVLGAGDQNLAEADKGRLLHDQVMEALRAGYAEL